MQHRKSWLLPLAVAVCILSTGLRAEPEPRTPANKDHETDTSNPNNPGNASTNPDVLKNPTTPAVAAFETISKADPVIVQKVAAEVLKDTTVVFKEPDEQKAFVNKVDSSVAPESDVDKAVAEAFLTGLDSKAKTVFADLLKNEKLTKGEELSAEEEKALLQEIAAKEKATAGARSADPNGEDAESAQDPSASASGAAAEPSEEEKRKQAEKDALLQELALREQLRQQQAAQQAANGGGSGGGGSGGGGSGGGGSGSGGGGGRGALSGNFGGENSKPKTLDETHRQLDPKANERNRNTPSFSELRNQLGGDDKKKDEKKENSFSFEPSSKKDKDSDETKKAETPSNPFMSDPTATQADPTSGNVVGSALRPPVLTGPTSTPPIIGFYGASAADPSFGGGGGDGGGGFGGNLVGGAGAGGGGGGGNAGGNSFLGGGDTFGSVGKVDGPEYEAPPKRVDPGFITGDGIGSEGGGESEGSASNSTTKGKNAGPTILGDIVMGSAKDCKIGIFCHKKNISQWCRSADGKAVGVCERQRDQASVALKEERRK